MHTSEGLDCSPNCRRSSFCIKKEILLELSFTRNANLWETAWFLCSSTRCQKKKPEESVNPNPLLNTKESERACSCLQLMYGGSFSPRDSSEGKAAPLYVGHPHFLSHLLNLRVTVHSQLINHRKKKRVSKLLLLIWKGKFPTASSSFRFCGEGLQEKHQMK